MSLSSIVSVMTEGGNFVGEVPLDRDTPTVAARFTSSLSAEFFFCSRERE